MKLSTRLTVAMVSLVTFTAAAVGLLAYHEIAQSILPGVLARLDARARLHAAGLEAHVLNARAAIMASAHRTAPMEFLDAHAAGGSHRADRISESMWRERLQVDWVAQLDGQPEYARYSLIGQDGRELIRVDRSGPGGGVRIVPESELRTQSDQRSFQDAIRLRPGEVYISPVELDRQYGVTAARHLPIVHIAIPVTGSNPGTLALLMVDIDMRPALAAITQSPTRDAHTFLVNMDGDYLVHPDASRAFGFDLGHRYRLQDDFPALSSALRAHQPAASQITDTGGKDLNAAVFPLRLAGGPQVAVIETISMDAALAAADDVISPTLLGGAAAALIAALLAVLVARSLTRPLNEMTKSLADFTGDEEIKLPGDLKGEVGTLADGFRRMADAVRDKTKALQREIEERARAEERFKIAVEASPGAMIMADQNGNIQLANAEADRMFEYDRGELLGKPIEILIPATLRAKHEHDRTAYVQEPSRRRMGMGRDLFGLRKDGSEFAIEIGLNPITTRDGTMVMAAIVDISERKQQEDRLSAHASELERSNAELEQFAYVASHDLQEPLRMVASYAELLSERYRGQLDAKADKYIQYAVDGAKRMQRLVNDLLAYSRVGRRDDAMTPTDTHKILQQVLKDLAHTIEKSGANVDVGLLPVIVADDGQIAQVFQNLIGNAVKFKSAQPVKIAIHARQSNEGWLFSVADNGIGIEAQYSDRIFQMFQRLHDRESYEGTGIGLTIAKKIVERHGGRIWFESTPGQGTTFYFTLPQIREKAA